MRSFLKFPALVLLSLLVLCSCTKNYIRESHRAPGFDPSALSSGAVLVIGSRQVQLNEFVKTYQKAFGHDSAFVQAMQERFAQHLKGQGLCTDCRVHKSLDGSVLSINSFNPADLAKANEVFDASTDPFIVNLTNFTVANRVETTTMANGAAGAGTTTTSSEYCVIRMNVQVWEREKKTKVLEFEAAGESSVSLFMFETALMDAMDRAVEHATVYLQSGKTEF